MTQMYSTILLMRKDELMKIFVLSCCLCVLFSQSRTAALHNTSKEVKFKFSLALDDASKNRGRGTYNGTRIRTVRT